MHKAFCRLVFLIFLAQSFQLQAKNPTRRGGNLAADLGAARAEIAANDDHRQGLFRRAFQESAKLLSHRAVHKKADGLPNQADALPSFLDESAQKAIGLAFAGDFQQFGGKLHFVGFAEDTGFGSPLRLTVFKLFLFVGFQLRAVFHCCAIDVMHGSVLYKMFMTAG